MKIEYVSLFKKAAATAVVVSMLFASAPASLLAAATADAGVARTPARIPALVKVGYSIQEALTSGVLDSGLSLNLGERIRDLPNVYGSAEMKPEQSPLRIDSDDPKVLAFLDRARQAGLPGGGSRENKGAPAEIDDSLARHFKMLVRVKSALESFQAADIQRMPLETLDDIARGLWETDNAFSEDSPIPNENPPPSPGLRRFQAAKTEVLRMVGWDIQDVKTYAGSPKKPVASKILRGAIIGVMLAAAPIATAFVLGPVDHAIGLRSIDFVPEAFNISPLLGWPIYLFNGMTLPILATAGGFIAYLSMFLSPKADTPGFSYARNQLLKAIVPLGLLLVGAIAGTSLGTGWLTSAAISGFKGFRVYMWAAGEEMLFRQYLLQKIYSSSKARGSALPWATAVLLSSVMFSIMHVFKYGLTLNTLILKIVLGIAFALIYSEGGGMAGVAAAHSLYNITVPLLPAAILHPSWVMGTASIALIGLTFLALKKLLPGSAEPGSDH